MTLSQMRKALERTSNSNDEGDQPDQPSADTEPSAEEQTKARLPPEERGIKESRSSLVTLEGRKGTLTFANTVGSLKRAGSSREGGGGAGLRKPPRRTAPSRTQSTAV